MKSLLLLTSCLAVRSLSHGGESHDLAYPDRAVATARVAFAVARSNVAHAIQTQINATTIGTKELDAVLTAVSNESTRLHKAGVDTALDAAVRRVETVRTQAVALLKDPANKAMAAGLEPEAWFDEITLQRRAGKIVESDLAQLRTTIDELRRWVSLVAGVAPPEQITSRLRARLNDVLRDWRRSAEASGQNSKEAEGHIRTSPRLRTAPSGEVEIIATNSLESPEQSTSSHGTQRIRAANQMQAVTVLSAPVAAVVKMTEMGAAEHHIEAFVDAYPTRFGLDANQIICLNGRVPSAITCRMVQHDAKLRASPNL
jgi:hypothetical protein